MSYRLAVGRALRSWPLLSVACVGAAAAVPLLPDLAPEHIAPFVGGPIALVALLRATRGAGRGDAFWRGFGGPAWARVAGAWTVDLAVAWLPLLVVASEAGVRLEVAAPAVEELTVVAALLFLGLLAAAAALSAARAVTTGGWALVGLPLYGLSFGLAMWASSHLNGWTFLAALSVRLGLLVLTGAAFTLYAEARFGAWGAGIRQPRLRLGSRSIRSPGARTLLAAAPLCVLGASVALEAAWPWPAGAWRVVALSDDGTTVVRIAGYDAEGWGRAWVWRDGVLSRLPGGRVGAVSVGPDGAFLVATANIHRGFHGPHSVAATLVTPDGVTPPCDYPYSPFGGVWPEFRADGRRVELGHVTLDVAAGCLRTPVTSAWSIGDWSGEEVEPDAFDSPDPVGGAAVTRAVALSWRGAAVVTLGFGRWLPSPRIVGGRLYLPTGRGDDGPAAYALGEGTVTLHEPALDLTFAEGTCRREDRPGAKPPWGPPLLRCTGPDGTERTFPADGHWRALNSRFAASARRLHDVVAGTERTLPPSAFGRHHASEDRREARMIGEIYRYATENALVDVLPDGSVRTVLLDP